MGEIADMMLEGVLCEECGEFIGEEVGHPRCCPRHKRQSDEVLLSNGSGNNAVVCSVDHGSLFDKSDRGDKEMARKKAVKKKKGKRGKTTSRKKLGRPDRKKAKVNKESE